MMKLQPFVKYVAQFFWWGLYVLFGAGILTHWVASASTLSGNKHAYSDSLPSLPTSLKTENITIDAVSPLHTNSINDEFSAYFYTGAMTSNSDIHAPEPEHNGLGKKLSQEPNLNLFRWPGGVSLAMNLAAYQQTLRYLNLSESVYLQDDLYGPATYQILEIMLLSKAALGEWFEKQNNSTHDWSRNLLVLHSPYEQDESDMRYVILARKLPTVFEPDSISYRF